MGTVVDEAVAQLNARLAGRGFDGHARFVLTGEGSLTLGPDGARAGDGEADVTMTAAPETFRAILAGEMGATGAFMSGKLAVDGDMGLAMRLASVLG